MAKTLSFPTIDDRKNVHGLINLYSLNKISRDDFMRFVANIISKYKIGSFPVFGYSVKILQWYKDVPVIAIKSDIIADVCPSCGSGTNEARYLRTEKENFDLDYDVISLNCLGCGCVYAAKGENHRTNKKMKVEVIK
ncbi:MAG: hypothetical protein Q8911_00230 [Bacillota bacterium]|nr:hypothetical protein [Bacillota bacterium]